MTRVEKAKLWTGWLFIATLFSAHLNGDDVFWICAVALLISAAWLFVELVRE